MIYKNDSKILTLVIMFLLIFFITDFILVQNQMRPLFCFISISPYNDGGTIYYIGLGYKVIYFNKLVGTKKYSTMYASYYYMCSWFTTYKKAWNKIADKAIDYSVKQYDEYYKENPPKTMDDKLYFTEVFEKYYGKEESEKLYNKISKEKSSINTKNNNFTESQKKQIKIVIKLCKNKVVLEEERAIFIDWLKGINLDELNDKNLQEEINNLIN